MASEFPVSSLRVLAGLLPVTERLSLFPLKTVLFPGTLLRLHIFEERYKQMIGRCLEERVPFGVVLIRSGEEVGGAAEPYDVGTTARIARPQRLPGGRLSLMALGERRFRTVRLDDSGPYLAGEVEYLRSEEADVSDAEEEARRVAALFGEQIRLFMAVTAQWVRRLDLPGDPDRLADFVAGNVDIEPRTKQELLEMLSVPERLRREADLLGSRIRKLTERWEEQRRQKFAGSALN